MAFEVTVHLDGAELKPPFHESDKLLVNGDYVGQVKITVPNDATVEWKLTPEGPYCGDPNPTPSTTTEKEFSFSPKGSERPSTKTGSKVHERAVTFSLIVTATSNGEKELRAFVIRQSPRAILRQEYIDFELAIPSLEQIQILEDAVHFKAEDFSASSNFLPYLLAHKGGMQKIADDIRGAFGSPLLITSAFRNPRRNRLHSKRRESVHQTGGAVDLVPARPHHKDPNYKIRLYLAALKFANRAILELQGDLLLPINWNPPMANHVFNYGSDGSSEVKVVDSDNDGLPDTVDTILNAPPEGIPTSTKFAYDGKGNSNPPFLMGEIPQESRAIRKGDRLFLELPTKSAMYNLEQPDRKFFALREYFALASHVHADDGKTQRLKTTPDNSRVDDKDPLGTVGNAMATAPSVLVAKWGTLANVNRLDPLAGAKTEKDAYESIENRAMALTAIFQGLLTQTDQTKAKPRYTWGRMPWAKVNESKPWPRIHLIDRLDGEFNAVVLHGACGAAGSDPLKVEEVAWNSPRTADIPYHFLIDRKGQIYEGRSLLFQGAHLEEPERPLEPGKEINANKIGLLLLSDAGMHPLESGTLSESQIAASIAFIKLLKEAFKPTLKKLGGHRDFTPSPMWNDNSGLYLGKCPGDLLYAQLDRMCQQTSLTRMVR